jgi:hypothetical protein
LINQPPLDVFKWHLIYGWSEFFPNFKTANHFGREIADALPGNFSSRKLRGAGWRVNISLGWAISFTLIELSTPSSSRSLVRDTGSALRNKDCANKLPWSMLEARFSITINQIFFRVSRNYARLLLVDVGLRYDCKRACTDNENSFPDVALDGSLEVFGDG